MNIFINQIRYSVLVVLIFPLYADVDYNLEIQPIFDSNCISCHHVGSGSYNNHGLDLTSYSGLMSGGEDGAVIIPGNSNASDLYDEISDGDMPPGNNPDLSNYHINLIAQWIDEGALQNIIGDINFDGDINVLDVVSIVNIVLTNEYNNLADLNSDGSIDVLDVVLLVNIILN